MRRAWLLTLSTMLLALAAAPAAQAERVFTVRGADGPGPARYDRVHVIEQGPRRAHNVLVLVPGTSAGAAYFRPVARGPARSGCRTGRCGRSTGARTCSRTTPCSTRCWRAGARSPTCSRTTWSGSPTRRSRPHFTPVADASVPFARRWGMEVAIGDLRNVIRAARRGGNRVVLGGHSLGGSITVAYATWDFGGRAGARGPRRARADRRRQRRRRRSRAREARKQLATWTPTSPFLDLTGLGLPWSAGVFNIVGSTLAAHGPGRARRARRLAGAARQPQAAGAAPPTPAATATRSTATRRPTACALVHMHIGSLAPAGDPRPWVDGELGIGRARGRDVLRDRGQRRHRPGTTRAASASTARPSPAASPTRPSGCSACARRTAATSTCRSTRSRPRSAPAACCAAPGRSRAGRTSRAGGSRWSTATPRTTTSTRSARSPSKNAFVKTVIPFLRRAE